MAITPTDFSFAQELTGLDYTLSGAGEILIDENSINAAAFFAAVKNGGGDIRVCTDAGGVNEIPIDPAICDTTLSKLKLYCRRPTYATESRNIVVFAGNAQLSGYADSDTFGRNNVYQDCEYASHDGLTDITGNRTPTQSGTALVNGYLGNPNSAREYNLNNSDYVYVSGLTVSNPYTLIVSSKVGTTAGTRIISLADSATTDQQIYIYSNFGTSVAAALGAFGVADASVTGSAGDRTTGVWRHYAGRVTSTTDRKVFLNSSALTGTSTAATSLTGIDRLAMGVSADSTPFGNQPISTADPRLYYDALTDDHIDMILVNRGDPSSFWAQGDAYDPSAAGGTVQPITLVAGVQSENAAAIAINQSFTVQSLPAIQNDSAATILINAAQTISGVAASQVETAGLLTVEQTQQVASIAAQQLEQAQIGNIVSAQAITLLAATQNEHAEPMNIGQTDGQLITLIEAKQNDNAQALFISQIQAPVSIAATQNETALALDISQALPINLISAAQFEFAAVMNILQTGDDSDLSGLVLVPVTTVYTLETLPAFTLETVSQNYTLEEN